ncbi:glycerol kinase GlpK [Spiroplasma endosymbiont of Panorpa germanica]|uniref:glycerol kinase GlpK n=1 Tax=Spiroplasma endosymbiont of Panorpa germanica TaxID=3066314 RepID=UPI0030D3D321
MKQKYIVTLDSGTSSVRTIVVDQKGDIVSQDQTEFTQLFPKSGWVEHDPVEIWNSQRTTLIQAMNKKKLLADQVAAIGITNQRETVVIWDVETGLPIYNAIVWQDRRTNDYCEELLKTHKEFVQERTGLIINPYFSASKVKWILDNVEGARQKAKEKKLMFGTINTWIIFKLTAGKSFVTDSTNASRTMLYNIHEKKWDKDLLELFDIPEEILPTVKSNSEIYGSTFPGLLSRNDFTQMPIASSIGDQQSALFGQFCLQPGEVKNTYGTGCFILMNTGQTPIKSENGLLTTVALDMNNKVTYALEGSVMIAGAAIQWLRDSLRIIYNSLETEWYAGLVNDDQRVYVVPSFSGLGSPYWDSYSRGAIFGLDRGTKREHIVRATLESLAYQSNDVIQAMAQDLKQEIKMIKVDGGASKNDYLMQFQADISQTQVIRPDNIETTAMGATYLAGIAVGFWKDINEIQKLTKDSVVLTKTKTPKEIENLLKGWKSAVERTFGWLK